MPGKLTNDLLSASTSADGDGIACPACSTVQFPTRKELTDGVYSTDCVSCGHFFKFKAIIVKDAATTVTFTVNGKAIKVDKEYAANNTLLEYLRGTRLSMGTKGMCLEGGCGACLVTMDLYHPLLKTKIESTINACLTPLYSCDGHSITTIEGLGNPRDGLNPIQERLAHGDGAQCGFCSSGQVMNMYGLLKENPKPTMKQVEDCFDATVCRCTGYRPILEAMKSFAIDADDKIKGKPIDIEELGGKWCAKNGKPCSGQCFSSNSLNRPLHVVSVNAQWFKPTTADELVKLLKQYKAQNYRLIFGNTGSGVYKELALRNYDILIDIRGIQEFYVIDFGPATLVLGSNLSINILKDLFNRNRTEPTTPYAGDFADHLEYVAMNGIRNLGCWAGNLMMKHHHNEFQSDMFTILEAFRTKLIILDENGTKNQYGLPEFLKLDMKGKVIMAMALPSYTNTTTDNFIAKTYRTSLRLQACHSYVASGFVMEVDSTQNFLIKSPPNIVMAGISGTFIHATLTENFLVNKQLGNPAVLKQALAILASEIVPTETEGQASAAYRKSLAIGTFYRYCLYVCKGVVDPRYQSGGEPIARPLMTATQDYDSNKAEWPVTEPMPKTIAEYLTSGAPAYLCDQPPWPEELHAAPVISSVGNAKILSIDATAALAVPGVVKFIQAKDIPTTGINNWRPLGLSASDKVKQELLSSGVINYAGQPLGIIVADKETTARYAASLVAVTYSDRQPVVTDLKDAVTKKLFFPDQSKPTVVGDPDGAISTAPKTVTGSITCGDQYHFYMETQTSKCWPNDTGGMNVKATSQWLDGVLETVAQVLGIPQSTVTVEIERLGGAYGGKITQNFLVSGLCALAAYVTGKPVKMHLDIHTNMKMLGKRNSYMANYKIGVDTTGKLLGLDVTMYEDCGVTDYESGLDGLFTHIDNAYYCANWKWTPMTVRTNKATNTACRAPASVPATFMIETMMDHVAKDLNLDPIDVRKENLYVINQKAPTGNVLDACCIRAVVSELETDVNIAQRKTDVETFNKANRWKKRGLAMTPNRFGVNWDGANYTTEMAIYHGDGSVAISHGGIDCGQGINTKVMQVCAYELGISMNLIRCKKSSTIINANSITTGGSVTTELCEKGIIECCNILKTRMKPIKDKMKDPTWTKLVQACYTAQVDLTASVLNYNDPDKSYYSIYSAGLVEAEIDVLTGQYQLRQSDLLYDCGQSINPELDIGQAEGAFMMGIGYFLNERVNYDNNTGEVINAGTWEYKPPLGKDLPLKYNFKFRRNATTPKGILGAKAIGEPPMTMSMGTLLAVKHAIEAARAEIGQTGYFPLSSPAQVDKVQTACLNDFNHYVYKPASLRF